MQPVICKNDSPQPGLEAKYQKKKILQKIFSKKETKKFSIHFNASLETPFNFSRIPKKQFYSASSKYVHHLASDRKIITRASFSLFLFFFLHPFHVRLRSQTDRRLAKQKKKGEKKRTSFTEMFSSHFNRHQH